MKCEKCNNTASTSDELDDKANIELCSPCYFVGVDASDSQDGKAATLLEWGICNNARREWREYGRHERASFNCPYFVDKWHIINEKVQARQS